MAFCRWFGMPDRMRNGLVMQRMNQWEFALPAGFGETAQM